LSWGVYAHQVRDVLAAVEAGRRISAQRMSNNFRRILVVSIVANGVE
jgi:hypothetical protein